MSMRVFKVFVVSALLVLGTGGATGGCNAGTGISMVNILEPENGAELLVDTVQVFRGRAFFSGNVPEGVYEWTSSQETAPLSTELALITDELGLGPHVITFRAQGFNPAQNSFVGPPVETSINVTVVERFGGAGR